MDYYNKYYKQEPTDRNPSYTNNSRRPGETSVQLSGKGNAMNNTTRYGATTQPTTNNKNTTISNGNSNRTSLIPTYNGRNTRGVDRELLEDRDNDNDVVTGAERRRMEYRHHHDDETFGRYSDHDDNDKENDNVDDDMADNDTFIYSRERRSMSLGSRDHSEDEEEVERQYDSDGEMLDQSSAELKATIEELEKRYDSIENEANEVIKELRADPEGNEWKTRYETQTEMNQQLEKQILMLQDKVEEAKRNLKEAGKSPRDNRAFDDLADASPQMVKALERERNSLFSQLRDLEWRLDQESKAYHKANDERKQYVLEINATRGNVGELKSKQRHMMYNAQEQPPRITGRSTQGESPRSYRDMEGNIPGDQRIIDPRYGPIKKTAGVKALPSLESV